jgi:UDP-glucose:(heptosyl)LPS alpha-1,3-glucosyltransferase
MDIFTVHSCHKAWITTAKKKADGWVNKLKKSWVNPLHALLVGIEGYSLRVSRKVVAISRLMEKEVVEYHRVAPSKVACIYNGIEITEFSIDNKIKYRNEVRRGLGIADNAFVVIFPAHEFRRKGLEEVIKAAAKLGRKDIVILVVGRDDPAPFVAIAEKSGIKKNVIYAGMVSDIQKYYAASDAMVFPTDYEPFGLVILEAMATGLPVITSRQAGAAELMIDGRNGLLLDDPRNIDDIAEKIKTLYEDRTYCENLGGEARKTAEKYSWDVITGETLKLYSKVVGARKA